MRKSLIIASTLALSVGAASAQTDQTTTPATPATTTQTTPAQTTPATTPATTQTATPATTTAPSQVTTFSDVPAGHWAKDAVDVIVQRGLIQGFPDGTFRGNESLTRYQAALIFYRLLQNGGLSSGNLSQGDLTTITRGIQEVSTELAALTTRVTDLERLSADQQARITAVEGRIAALGTGTAAGTDTAALTARVDALEAAARTAGTTTTTPTTTTTGTDTTTTTGTTGTDTTATTPGTVVIGETAPAATPARGNLYAGVTVGASGAPSTDPCYIRNSGGRAVNSCVSFGGVIGSTQIIGPVGARVAADYRPGRNAISADVNATYALNLGRFQPYGGLGLGLTSSRTRATATNANPTGNSTDTYLSAVLGVDFQITDSISAFAEADARYYLTNKGTGAVQNSTDPASRGFGNAGKVGVKFYF